MRLASILCIILMAVGILSLAYFASPMRLMFHSSMGLPEVDPSTSFLGGLALLGGLVLLLVIGSKHE
ncbi:MAG: hypothetical protein WA510_26130 [Acidobacteriaceae bacterium]